MGFKFIDEVSIADLAFELEGNSEKELFKYATEALANAIIKNINLIKPNITKRFVVEAELLEDLLVQFVQRLIYYKDVDWVIFRTVSVRLWTERGKIKADCTVKGDKLFNYMKKDQYLVDVKAATVHLLKAGEENGVWKARMVLDI